VSITPLLVTYQVWKSPRVAWTGVKGEALQSEWLHDARSYAQDHGYDSIKIQMNETARNEKPKEAPTPSPAPMAKDRLLTEQMRREVAANTYSRDTRSRALASAASGAKRPWLNQAERSALSSWPVSGVEIQSLDMALLFDQKLYQRTQSQHVAVISLLRQGWLVVISRGGQLRIIKDKTRG
jgi:hypothetical protein